jgi:hypothetical protein
MSSNAKSLTSHREPCHIIHPTMMPDDPYASTSFSISSWVSSSLTSCLNSFTGDDSPFFLRSPAFFLGVTSPSSASASSTLALRLRGVDLGLSGVALGLSGVAAPPSAAGVARA